MTRFRDRADAGRALAARLERFAGRPDASVLALPRGGVPVAFEIARVLRLPLDVLLVRKLGVPGHEEVAMGAIASGGIRVLNEDIVEQLAIAPEAIEAATARERAELVRRDHLYRGARPPPRVEDERVILVDDGLATGATMRAAVTALRVRGPRSITVAVPVGSRQACDDLARVADEVVCVNMTEDFHAVSAWYEHFGQTSDDEVRDLLRTMNGVRLHRS